MNKLLVPVSIVLISMSLLFSSCSGGGKNPTPPPAGEKNAPRESPKDKEQTPKTSQQVKLQKPVVIRSWEEYEAVDLPLISAIPDRKINLYGIKPKGVVLYFEDKGHYFDWPYITPRFILPEMKTGDYDKDGKDELSVILYVGAGTGYSVEDLHVIELAEKEVLSNNPSDQSYFLPNPQYFKDNYYQPDDYVKQVNNLVKLKTYYDGGELKGTVTAGNQKYEISLKSLQSNKEKVTVTGVYFGDIVNFNAEADKLTVQMAMGITTRSFAAPRYVGEIHTDVNYKAGRFTLSNLRYVPGKE